MKKIAAIIKPFQLAEFRIALDASGEVEEFTAFEVCGFSGENRFTAHYRGVDYEIDFHPMIQVEVVVDNANLEHVLSVVRQFSAPRQSGGGKATVLDIERTIRICTMPTVSFG